MHICEICKKQFLTINGLSAHIFKHNLSCKEYYDKYLKKPTEGICKYCHKETFFYSLSKGYLNSICGSCNLKNIDIKKNLNKSKKLKETLKIKSELKQKRKELIDLLKIKTIDKSNKNQCQICGHLFSTTDSLTKHLKRHKITLNKYYDLFFKSKNENICLCYKEEKTCKKFTKFISLEKGYNSYCSNKCVSVSYLTKTSIKDTCIKKYNTTHPFKNNDIKAKQIKGIKKTIKKNGKEILEKRKKTCINKYGVEFVSQVESYKKKQKQSFKKFKESNDYKVSRSKLYNTYLESTFFPNMKKILDEQNLELIGEYKKAHTSHLFRCKKCNTTFRYLWMTVQNGIICKTCNNNKSKPEIDIGNFLKEQNIYFLEHDRLIISPFELDFFIKDMNIAIEYCGLFWHSEINNHNPYYHLNKLEMCLENNIKLLQIFEDEWIFKKPIVLNRLKHILGLNNYRKIYARKCIIKEITNKEKNLFLESYHIQGKDNSKIKLGAFYNDELVSVMTFSHGNISKGSKKREGVWELNRFCTNYNYHIPGIASKLLSHFKRNYEWKEIFSYADRRWSDGNLYYKLGFLLEKITKPNYWYCKDYQRIHRFNLRKKPDEPKDITEWKLRHEQGYYRIWDCGHLKFKLTKHNN